MYKGIPIAGKYFFALLYSDPGFCQQLGRAVLAAGRLETELKKLLAAHSTTHGTKRATLGTLLRLTKEKDLLSKMQSILEMVKTQRNYLTHDVYALLSGWIEETILEGSNLLDSDVHTYTERALLLADNLNFLADAVERENSAHNNSLQVTAPQGTGG